MSFYIVCEMLNERTETFTSKLIAASWSSDVISCSFSRSLMDVLRRNEHIKEIGWNMCIFKRKIYISSVKR